MKKLRNFLMRPDKYHSDLHNLDGWFICEYKHGLHCFWDGGLSRGQLVRDIPWAQDSTGGSIEATGLWSYNLTPIVSISDKWTNQFPTVFLEGVIYQEDGVKYFGATASPSPQTIFKSGMINRGENLKSKFDLKNNLEWVESRKKVIEHLETLPTKTRFDLELKFLSIKLATYGSPCHLLKHKQLSLKDSKQAIIAELEKYPNGITARCPGSYWNPECKNQYLLVI